MRDIGEFYLKAQKFLREFDGFAKLHGLQKFLRADHLCYKCDSPESFERIRKILEYEKFVYQSIISKRRIAMIKVKTPLNSILGNIDLIELSDQKPDGSQEEGFDHVEVFPKTISYDELISNLNNAGLKLKEIVRPHHTTYDIEIKPNFILRLSREPLIEKIKREEMN
jgi:predicted metalloenzyme YecM